MAISQHLKLWLICIPLCLFGLVPTASDWAFANTAQSALQAYFKKALNTDSIDVFWSAFVSSTQIANVLASIIAPWFAERLGRPNAMCLALVIVMFGHLFQFLAKFISGGWPLLFIGRFINSIGGVPFTIILPIFISEIAPLDMRGQLGVCAPISMLCGLLLSGIFGLTKVFGNERLWPYPYLICLILHVPTTLTAFLFLRETPVYLMAQGDAEGARNALIYYRGTDTDLKLVQIDAETKKKGMHPGLTAFYHLLKAKPLYKPLLISSVIIVSYAAVNILDSYSTVIFRTAGYSNETASFLTLGLQIASIFSFLICFPLIDKYGRRLLIIPGLIGSSLGWTAMFALQLALNISSNSSIGIGLVIITYVTMIFVNFGIRAIFWVLIPEIFPYNYRSVAKAFTIVLSGLFSFVFLFVYYSILKAFAPAAHALMAITLIFALIYLYFNLPETKGKAPHEIFPAFLNLPLDLDSEEETPLLGSYKE